MIGKLMEIGRSTEQNAKKRCVRKPHVKTKELYMYVCINIYYAKIFANRLKKLVICQ